MAACCPAWARARARGRGRGTGTARARTRAMGWVSVLPRLAVHEGFELVEQQGDIGRDIGTYREI